MFFRPSIPYNATFFIYRCLFLRLHVYEMHWSSNYIILNNWDCKKFQGFREWIVTVHWWGCFYSQFWYHNFINHVMAGGETIPNPSDDPSFLSVVGAKSCSVRMPMEICLQGVQKSLQIKIWRIGLLGILVIFTKDCLKQLDDDAHKVYLQYFFQIDSICHQLQ